MEKPTPGLGPGDPFITGLLMIGVPGGTRAVEHDIADYVAWLRDHDFQEGGWSAHSTRDKSIHAMDKYVRIKTTFVDLEQ